MAVMVETMMLAQERLDKLRRRLEKSGHDAVLALSPANVAYASGYRSVSAAVHGRSSVGVLVTGTDLLVIGPAADSAPAFDFGIGESDYLAYGRFYFESADSSHTASGLADQHESYAHAISAGLARLNLGSRRVLIDDSACPESLRRHVASLNPACEFVDGSEWLLRVRSQKLPGEVDALERAARLTEDAIFAAIDAAAIGVTERDLAGIVGRTIVEAGGEPKFLVVTSGPRSALADAYAVDRPLQAGDLLRFDVGCILDGYWSDLGRTAVMGEPTARQASYYKAILAGVDRQLEVARPGVPANELFDVAVKTVEEAGGPAPYRRQHCGHGIGLDVYEAPIVQPAFDTPLEEGMTFCFETPYYELGWGGMMVEDALVVTADGVRMLSDRRRGLSVVAI